MEKISGILASSNRVTAVDLNEGHAVRPGAPSFGQRMGVSSLEKTVNKSSIDPMSLDNPNLTFRQKSDLKHAQLVKNLTDGFFMRKQNRVAQVSNDIYTNDMKLQNTTPGLELITEARAEVDTLREQAGIAPVAIPMESREAQESEVISAEESEATPEYIRPGRYVDVTA